MSSKPLVLVNPITFKVDVIDDPNPWEHYTRKFLDDVAREIAETQSGKSDIERLKIANDKLVDKLPNSEWNKLPSDSRFPGFFSSLADHAIATSTVGVALAQQCFFEGKSFASEYADKELGKFLADIRSLTQVVRLGCLLHDAGKPLPTHPVETERAVEAFLSNIGFGRLATELAEAASRHHYGKDAERPPGTLLEWVIAYADKVAVQDRSILSKKPRALAAALRGLHTKLPDARIPRLAELLESEDLLKPEEQIEDMQLLLPLAKTKRRSLEGELLNAPERLGIREKPLSVLLLEAEGIQGIVRRSEALRGLVGLSALVELGMEKAADVIRSELALESLVFVGGGSLMALIPTSRYEELKEKARRTYWETVQGAGGLKAPVNGKSVTFTLYELKNGPDFAWEALEGSASLSLRSFAQVYTVATQALESAEPMQPYEGEQRLSPRDVCTVCRMEKALPQDDPHVKQLLSGMPGEEVGERFGRICLASYQLRNEIVKQLGPISISVNESGAEFEFCFPGGEASLSELPAVSVTHNAAKSLCVKLREQLKKDPIFRKALAGKKLTFRPVKTIDDLGKQMYTALKIGLGGNIGGARYEEMDEIAVIAGDGDNFGMIKSSMVNVTQYRHVSDLFKAVIMDGLAEALSTVLLRQIELGHGGKTELELPFLVIYAGGDDFLLLLDASAVLIFLKGLNDYITSSFGSRTNEYLIHHSTQFIGLSLGVAVVKNRMPIYAALEAVAELEKRAKKKSKEVQAGGSNNAEKDDLCFGSGITVALHRFTGLPSEAEVEDLYQKRCVGDLGIIPTAWPRTSEELFGPAGFTSILEKLLQAGVVSGELKRVLRGGEDRLPEEVKLILRFKAAREGEGKGEVRGPYTELAEKAVLCPLSFDKGDGVVRYAFPDIAEAMKIILDRQELLPR